MKKLTLFLLLAIPLFTLSQVIHVPDDYPTIQEGINAATDGDTVLVAEDTYYENIRFIGKAIMLASEYILDGDSLHIVNTIIDGSQPTDPDSAATVMFVNGEDTTTIINGFTITGGSGVYNNNYKARWGGGIYSWNAGCKVINNLITANEVEDDDKAGGAGIGGGYVTGSADYWIVVRENYIGHNTAYARGYSAFGGGMSITTNCIIENNLIEYNTCTNTVGMADGGGIELEGPLGTDPITYIINNIIRHNELDGKTLAFGAGINVSEVTTVIKENIISDNIGIGGDGSWGGGVRAYNSANLNISNNIIENNLCEGISKQSGGGGINLLKCSNSNVSHNEINSNSISAETNAWGGGILIDKATDTVVINNNCIKDNITGGAGPGFGGGISFYTTDDIAVFINSNKVINNYSHYRGGGICARNTYRMYITNNLFEKNESTNRGGAIMFYETSSKLKRDEIIHPMIVNNTFFENITNHFGGAVYSGYDEETPIIYNSIFWDNSANSDQDLYNSSNSVMEIFNNDIDITNISTPWIGADNIFDDPKFVMSDDHPCQINDYSPCINKGATDTSGLNLPEYDLAGEMRIFNERIDIGAYEWNTYVGIEEFEVKSPKFEVKNYPNPFSTYTSIEYELNQSENVTLTFYNQFGEQVDVIEERHQKGLNKVLWTPENLADGIYYFRLEAGEQAASGEIVLVE